MYTVIVLIKKINLETYIYKFNIHNINAHES